MKYSVANVHRLGIQVLQKALSSREEARRDAAFLLAHVLSYASPLDLLTKKGSMPVSRSDCKRFFSFLRRRQRREPVPYITGETDFMGQTLAVSAACLIPRPETELLVETVCRWIKKYVPDGTLSILDIGTGSGAIAIALAASFPHARIDACDISAAALTVARENAARNNVAERISFYTGSLFEPAPQNKHYTVIVSNPPYVSAAEMVRLEPELYYEPPAALVGGIRGDEVIQKIIVQAPAYLMINGGLFLEIGATQGASTYAMLCQQHYTSCTILKDYAGHDRIAAAVKSRENWHG